jgi:hypothetical protein
MLKKVGIVVAGATAAVLAVSPLAFAGEGHYHGKDSDRGVEVTSSEQNSEGLVNITDTNVNPALNVCDNQIPINVLGVQVPLNDTSIVADLSGALGLGLLGDAEAKSDRGDGASLSDDCIATTSTDAVNG